MSIKPFALGRIIISPLVVVLINPVEFLEILHAHATGSWNLESGDHSINIINLRNWRQGVGVLLKVISVHTLKKNKTKIMVATLGRATHFCLPDEYPKIITSPPQKTDIGRRFRRDIAYEDYPTELDIAT